MMEALFAVTLFVAASLLFWVQLFTAKMLLPVLGGSAAVWNICLVFFQLALLLGYLYAHASARWLKARWSGLLQPLLLLAAAAALPVSMGRLGAPASDANPVPWLLGALLVMVGPPFVVLAATAPLLQSWFSRLGTRAARDPYFLYAASNLGSLGALLAYPTLIEPHLTLAAQSRDWTAAYLAVIAFSAACALVTARHGNPDRSDASRQVRDAVRIGWLLRARWVLLAFVPSSLLLGVTAHLTADVAAAPLFWVVPLILYLASFVLAFQTLVRIPERATAAVQALLLVVLAVTLLADPSYDPLWLFALHLAAFFATALLCHQEVARLRPPAQRLTEFYLFVSLGGALGGMFNALLAPILFDRILEYPLALVLACALRPGIWPGFGRRRAAVGELLLPLCFVLPIIALQRLTSIDVQDLNRSAPAILTIGAALIAFSLRRRPLGFTVAIAALLAAGGIVAQTGHELLRSRNFYGVLRVTEGRAPPQRILLNGTTRHGSQSLDPERRLEPLSYYHRHGPLGQLFAAIGGTKLTRRVGVVGLGAGSIACYAHAGERWTFFDINPAVIAVARDPALFTFLADCPARPEIVLGDARLSLARAPDAAFDMLIFDAFNSDAIPVHLMTEEAVRLYLRKLAPGGILVFHISNRLLSLAPVLGSIADTLGIAALYWDDRHSPPEPQKDPSQWAMLARGAADFAPIGKSGQWTDVPRVPAQRPWTDDYSDLFDSLRY